MSANIVTAIYIAASVLFILSLGGLSNQESAKRAVWYGIVGMALAVGATIFGPQVEITLELMLMIAVGSVIGLVVARRVDVPSDSRTTELWATARPRGAGKSLRGPSMICGHRARVATGAARRRPRARHRCAADARCRC